MAKKYPDIISLGELLVDIMRDEINTEHRKIGATYRGPFPSGAPAIFVDSAARMGKPFDLSTGFIGVIGNDEFGDCILEKLHNDNVDTSQIRITSELTTGIAFNQYNSDGSRKFIFAKGAAGETSELHIKEEYFQNIKNIHIMGSALSISKKSRDACYKALKVAKEILKLNFGLIKTGINFKNRLPLGKFGKPDEVALIALVLASDLSSYVHGSLIPVDGGFLSA